ncbi:13272_t:CDS:2 [Ambispora gerdemannii]|uniref:13272_t:CDS:1 n=1 Tax=Ambispora gerdemannii TaxID=144530 RepID=A0A9N9FUC2_9GLOM|nr:13272_t:CDS:2 [Ambispora gerdemannii]
MSGYLPGSTRQIHETQADGSIHAVSIDLTKGEGKIGEYDIGRIPTSNPKAESELLYKMRLIRQKLAIGVEIGWSENHARNNSFPIIDYYQQRHQIKEITNNNIKSSQERIRTYNNAETKRIIYLYRYVNTYRDSYGKAAEKGNPTTQ